MAAKLGKVPLISEVSAGFLECLEMTIKKTGQHKLTSLFHLGY
jgi:hypothetical protein